MIKVETDIINIKDLVIEAPAKRLGLPFDPEKYVTDADLLAVKDAAKVCLESKNDAEIGTYIRMLANMRVVSPDRFRKIYPKLTMENEVRELFVDPSKSGPWFLYLGLLAYAKTIYPGQLGELSSVQVWEGLYNQAEDYRKKLPDLYHRFDTWLQAQANLKILNPDLWKVTSEASVKKILDQNRAKILEATGEFDDGSYFLHGELLPSLRIVSPNHFPALNSEMKSWQTIIHDLKKYREYSRRDNWSLFIWIAEKAKILAAERVVVTEEGLDITMPRNLDIEELPSLPIKRSF